LALTEVPKFDIPPGESYNESTEKKIMPEKKHLIIGLTGNIGSGKSTVLNMLRHLGAYGVDADALTRKAYQQEDIAARIKKCFGSLDRKVLAQRVFNDAQALADLEAIIHPQVTRIAHKLIAHAVLPVIVIEAIKLLESDLAALCDWIWVVAADDEQVIQRLVKGRAMDPLEIEERLTNQSPYKEKAEKADVVIQNGGTREETWKQIKTAWQNLMIAEKYPAISERTHALISPFSRHIVQPFSPAHMRVRAMIAEEQSMHLDPNDKTIPLEMLDEWVCDGIVFASGDVADGMHFSAWQLNTFNFNMHAAIEFGQDAPTGKGTLPPALAEQFARMHRVESLMIAIGLPLNESIKQDLEFRNFISANQKLAETTQWFKAGYNVFYKQIWNLLADLENMH